MDTFRAASGESAAREGAVREIAARMAMAAAAWLDELDPAQRAVAVGRAPSSDAGSDAERRRWFYTPTDHGGLPLGAQRPAQQRLAHQLVATGLSPAGYGTVATIIGLENVLDYVEGEALSTVCRAQAKEKKDFVPIPIAVDVWSAEYPASRSR